MFATQLTAATQPTKIAAAWPNTSNVDMSGIAVNNAKKKLEHAQKRLSQI
jgi:hypothetical protein